MVRVMRTVGDARRQRRNRLMHQVIRSRIKQRARKYQHEKKDIERERRKRYNQLPHVKKKRREYDRQPHVKQQRWLYNQRPEVKERRKAYSKRDDVRFRRRLLERRRRQAKTSALHLVKYQVHFLGFITSSTGKAPIMQPHFGVHLGRVVKYNTITSLPSHVIRVLPGGQLRQIPLLAPLTDYPHDVDGPLHLINHFPLELPGEARHFSYETGTRAKALPIRVPTWRELSESDSRSESTSESSSSSVSFDD
jgi:hypothetical protein